MGSTTRRMSTVLREMLKAPGMIVAPGAYDCITATLIKSAGFKAAYMTGGGTALAQGYPDYGLLTMAEMAANVARITACIDIPLIADADTGYGNELNVVRTVRVYEQAGVAAIQLEDQVMPKRCGHIAGKKLVSSAEFADKVSAAVEFRQDPDLVIVARTDACNVEGVDKAIERSNAYRRAGADVIFVEAPASEQELAKIGKEVDAPLLCNLIPGGKTPILSPARLQELGFKIVIYPGACLVGAIRGVGAALERVRTGAFVAADVLSPMDITAAASAHEWTAIDQRFTKKEPERIAS